MTHRGISASERTASDGRPLGENEVDELRHFHTRRSRRVGFGNDHLGYCRHQLLLIRIQRSERHIAQPAMDLLRHSNRFFGISGNEGQRQGGAEELDSFSSSHLVLG